MAKAQQKRVKPPPIRTCIACRESKPKRELLRVVRTPDGHVLLDATGKKAGRGAYLCAKLNCWELALKRKRLEQTFEIAVSPEDLEALNAFVATLPADEPVSARPADMPTSSVGKKQGSAK
ncbi:MAG TPA: YlxR family protein [Ktedonobacteraceae bacterium]|nr:YlxR family protein [Ktedonobacteraceae bacterium]